MTVQEAIRLLTDEAERQGAEPNDDQGIVRALVTSHGLSFNAWFCVCCELADRGAQRQGFRDQGHRAAERMVTR
jgi:hypothetical protein